MAAIAETQPRLARYGTTTLDRWMATPFRLRGREVKRRTVALIILGAPAAIPLLFTVPAVLTGDGSALGTGGADTLGTGSEILLITTLLISPMVTLTRQRWFVPLRRWYPRPHAGARIDRPGAARPAHRCAAGTPGSATA